jgi:hypothetical protein
MAEQQKEVNVDVDKVELEPSEAEEGEEVITKPEDIEEKETPSDESSTEKEPSETEEGEEEPPIEGKGEKLITHKESLKPEEDKGFVEPSEEESEGEIKHLPGETPREYALRWEVTRLKRGNREKRAKDLLGEEKPEKPSGITQAQYNELNDDEKSLLGQYDANELSTFEKILEVLAKKHGWVKREDLASTTRSQVSNDILDDFLQNHSEYLPENDKDNVLWGRFKSEFQLYKVPENPKDLKRIFNKIHQDIFGVKSDEGLKKINAQKEKIKVVSHSGGSATRGQSSSEGARLTPEQRSHFKGFSEKDFEELEL